MKKKFVLFGIVALLVISFSSCVASKRDCQGRRHTRLTNGIYL